MTRGPTLSAHPAPYLPRPLDAFNAAPADEARGLLLRCLRSDRWAHRIADHRPYPDLDALLAATDEAAYDLAPADLAQALAGEPLPELPADAYAAAHTALSAALAAYEARFGHVFVVDLGGVPPAEALDRVLEAIRSRWANDPEEERAITAEELRRLARGRITGFLRGEAGNPSGASLITQVGPP
ncbi:2-oxo-4-hydroxy-4-carboxy-5-ureidoimidazoline decarboxylase [Streptomyces sp. LP11]|uniref:2-oxo-4-hydroxy-4-carboxy-5-ureidoimidazoline decarboxylase n=1 Tax=Streptomyces pyxinicus TaxID=2970331 RepID=A0ABT2B874_9ACTN|nr:2-oxo-4-hydroxy-4-carboxy-5-ureidoimidazoline decarboxylase [Streptomyces sp. LP11]MCS0604724.1 2-oxo-4-hydroxy-4-carboxy-5-ureidoimidazoline decarboxylase [Streptomyces sp. LP11]